MDAHRFSSQVEVLSVTDSGRRRRWSQDEKTRIVEESLSRPRAVAATARRHQIARALLTRWRAEYRRGLLGAAGRTTFVPVAIPTEVTAAPDAAPAKASVREAKVEVTLTNGRRVLVPASIDPAVLARLLPVLDGA
jgi:transposase